MFRSLRIRLTVWYVGVFAIILVTLGIFLYLNVTAKVASDVDDLVAAQADGMADAVFFFWEGERLSRFQRQNLDRVSDETLNREFSGAVFSELLHRWSEGTNEWDAAFPVRIVDTYGLPVLTSLSFERLQLPLTLNAIENAREQKTVYETIAHHGVPFRVITRPVTASGRLLFIVQSTTSLGPSEEVLLRLRWHLLSMIPLALLTTGVCGYFLAGRTMRPVERSYRRLRQFSAAASHELRTPLTVMKGEIEVTLKYSKTAEEYRESLETHLSAVNEMTAIVQELLLLARSDTGPGAVEWIPVNLTEMCTVLKQTYQTIADEKSVHLFLFESGDVWVSGEKRLLERLVSNLIDNAIKHTPPDGRVTIRIGRRVGEAFISVADTGAGIRPEDMDHLFDKFFSKRARESDPVSTGLGLGLCRWVAEAHQGRIDVSPGWGKGTTFMLWLPLGEKPKA